MSRGFLAHFFTHFVPLAVDITYRVRYSNSIDETEMDMQTPCFNSIAADRYLAAKERADEMHASRWQRLYTELMQGWFKCAKTVVSCPDSHQTSQSVQEVVSDYLDGTAPQRENDRAEVLSIIAAAALGQNVSDRARAFMDRVASAHADWHAETVGDE